MRIVNISDTHNMHDRIGKVPDGDVLIHAGDMSGVGKGKSIKRFTEWMKDQPHKHKIVIPGNHDLSLDPRLPRARRKGALTPIEEVEKYFKDGITLLRHEEVTIESLKFFGSPYTPEFYDWAFMYKHSAAEAVWSDVPKCDVLITHGPAWQHHLCQRKHM